MHECPDAHSDCDLYYILLATCLWRNPEAMTLQTNIEMYIWMWLSANFAVACCPQIRISWGVRPGPHFAFITCARCQLYVWQKPDQGTVITGKLSARRSLETLREGLWGRGGDFYLHDALKRSFMICEVGPCIGLPTWKLRHV